MLSFWLHLQSTVKNLARFMTILKMDKEDIYLNRTKDKKIKADA